MHAYWFYVPVNPEPWAIGSISIGKKNGAPHGRMSPNAQLVAYKEAIAEHLREESVPIPPGEYTLTFYFFRALDDYETGSGRRHRKHQADATNLQKATEDALQGILFANDRDVRDVRSVIVEQGADVKPGIFIKISEWCGLDPDEIPDHVWNNRLDNVITLPGLSDNAWPPAEDGF